jgi:hypothetical protein
MKKDQSDKASLQRLTFREEFLELYHRAPRAMFVLLLVISLTLVLNYGIASLGGLLISMILFLAVLLALLVLPAFVGAAAGSLIGNTVGWFRARLLRH